MPVASAAPIAMPKLRRSRLPRKTTVGWRLWASMKSPTTPASCGPAGAGVWAGRCAGEATSAPAMSNGSPMCGISASFAISTLLRGAGPHARQQYRTLTEPSQTAWGVLTAWPTRRRKDRPKPAASSTVSVVHMTKYPSPCAM